MKNNFCAYLFWRNLSIALFVIALLASPASGWQQAAPAKQTAAQAAAQTATQPAAQSSAPVVQPMATLSAVERQAAANLKAETIREATVALAAPNMEGRGTMQPGGERAAKYIADRFQKLGLKPLGDAGTYLQAAKFVSSQLQPETALNVGTTALKLGDDFVPVPPYSSDQASASGELLFVGYGVVSPELKRDDFAGLDLKGKIVVVMRGRPKDVDAEQWQKATNRQTVFGNLFTRGVAGVIVTNIATPQQPYPLLASYLTRRSVELAGASSQPKLPFALPPIMATSDAGMEKLFAGSGTTYAATKAKLENGEIASQNLGKTASMTLRIKREEGTSSNVVGVLEGFDPKLKEEAVIYTAHYDAYGIDNAGRIYPGAADNALGVGTMLGIAEAFTKTNPRPRRSIIFLAVTGEEYGLLGTRYWANNPTWPLPKIAANLNYDGIGTEIYAPVKRIVAFGAEHSDLGKVFEQVTAATGNIATPDPMPEEQAFYRSDHYIFVVRGIPALMMLGGPAGDPQQWIGRAQKWLTTDYHQPTDTVQPDWNWGGARTSAEVGLIIGMRVANTDQMPAWLPSSPFNRERGTTAPPPPRSRN